MNLEKIADGLNFTSKLLEALNLRSQNFFECDAFIAALLLDPRFAWNSTVHEVFNDLLRSRGIDRPSQSLDLNPFEHGRSLIVKLEKKVMLTKKSCLQLYTKNGKNAHRQSN